MTRCCSRSSMNVKSSVYNQTGESSTEQLASHRLMCSHLRRVMMAKCVVDTRNPRYALHRATGRRCGGARPASCKLRFLDRDFCCQLSSETIDKLAYDTEHHPSEIIRVTCRGKSSTTPSSRLQERSCSRERASSRHANCPCCQCGKGSVVKSNLKNQKPTEDCCAECCCKQQQQQRPKEFDYDKQRAVCDAKSCEGSPCRSSRSRKEAAAAGSPRGAADEQQTFRKLAEREEEDALYSKFVYDITQEIVQNGLYTDRELKEVFAKHLERCSARLNKRKMLYEIYQLKISLNMMDDSEDDDEVEADLVYAEKFATHRVPKPPTPPKVLNENKVLEKLQSFQDSRRASGDCSGTSTPLGRKGVVLVDANPEFLVTEHDVLATLADNDVEPQQIQRIYKRLFQKSKDMSLTEAVQVGTEVAYTHRLKQVDRCTSATSIDSTYMRERPHGILRKESTDFLGKSLSPETSRRRYNHLLEKRDEALEKCNKWRTCDCATQPCKGHLDLLEREKDCVCRQPPPPPQPRSPEKIPTKEVRVKDKPQKRPSPDKKVKVVKQPAKVKKKPEKIKAEKPIKVVVVKKMKKVVESSPEISDHTSSDQEVVTTEEKQDLSAKAESSVATRAENEELEEIEEDIEESAIDESSSPAKSPSRRSSLQAKDKPDNEEKEQASSPEKSGDDDQSSIATEREQESAKYSDDFSDVSDDSSEDDVKSSATTSKSKKLSDKARYTSMKDYFDRFATIDEQKMWRISEASSDSSSSEASLANQRASVMVEPVNPEHQQQLQLIQQQQLQQQQQQETSKGIRKRSSSGVLFRVGGDSWRERVSGLSNDFYASSSGDKYCDPNCRGDKAKSCSDNCRFVKTNCRNLSRPTDCLNKLKRPVLSSESASTSS